MTTVLHADPPLQLHAAGDPPPSAPGHLRVEPWPDPVVDEMGHDPRSSYVETFWLPVLGPSTTWLLRRFASHLDDAPGGVVFEVEDLARRLGIGERSGPNSPFARTVKRCVDFQMAEWHGASLAVRRHLPPLARRHLQRLPETLQAEHQATMASVAAPPPLSERLRIHGRRLALSLLDYGDDQTAAETQLVRWGFHPAIAVECATFAGLEHARREAARAAHPAGPRTMAPTRLRAPASRSAEEAP
ncbi:MAG: hypothetical protein ACLQK4_01255 [Acidimicrobiales bacterium]|jgi:hypothetical protein